MSSKKAGPSRLAELEAVLAGVAIFEQLRPDEIGRIARRFAVIDLAAGERHEAANEARLVIVIRGEIEVEVCEHGETLRARMATGDRIGTFSLVTGEARPLAIAARRPARLAVLDRAAFTALLGEFPAIAVPLARELASEVAVRDDFLRQLLELQHARLPVNQLQAAIREREAAQHRRGAHVARSSTRGLFQRLVVQQGAEPPFWMLIGFLLSLGGARLVVHLILKYHLESRLFALVPGNDPNPMHVHHFNYGLLLVSLVGLLALAPRMRQRLRMLAFLFGIGLGLVVDEFALLWNLNPDYYQPSSRLAALAALFVLFQTVYLRSLWAGLARRVWARILS